MSDAANKSSSRDKTQMFQSQTQSTTGGDSNAAEKAAPPCDSLLTGYQPDAEAFDEFLGPKNEVRPHYASLLTALEDFSPTEIQRRYETCERLVHEQGITY